MNDRNTWLDTETQALLEPLPPKKLAPPATAGFTLVLIEDGPDQTRIARAIVRARGCPKAEAQQLASKSPPLTVAVALTHDDALLGQFELVCADCISVFLEDGVASRGAENYLSNLYAKLRKSPEFARRTVELSGVPDCETGTRFLDQFLGISLSALQTDQAAHILTAPAKKARIMKHWAEQIGATLVIRKEST